MFEKIDLLLRNITSKITHYLEKSLLVSKRLQIHVVVQVSHTRVNVKGNNFKLSMLHQIRVTDIIIGLIVNNYCLVYITPRMSI